MLTPNCRLNESVTFLNSFTTVSDRLDTVWNRCRGYCTLPNSKQYLDNAVLNFGNPVRQSPVYLIVPNQIVKISHRYYSAAERSRLLFLPIKEARPCTKKQFPPLRAKLKPNHQ